MGAADCVTWSNNAAAASEVFKQSAVNAVRCKKGMSRGYTPQQRSSCMTPQKASFGSPSMGGYGNRLMPSPPLPSTTTGGMGLSGNAFAVGNPAMMLNSIPNSMPNSMPMPIQQQQQTPFVAPKKKK